ncbi:chorismate synthase [Vulcanimicrobium alpinum]|uniref:Chorismate synthase n=1 Tax=Vulcanimicrobium alpinum TaxID=3016050 RepID=A0AAN1Y096_UNVUL|nr:chorismate synthase [Vulcanimicrobium alpinum]BDE07853.1 chorismate synthase [Vulcanimicrobium alpinum]
MSLRHLTAGESHGAALVGILEGMPSGLPLDIATLHAQAKRRKLGFGRGNRQTIETDEVRILSGVRRGVTIGSPIALMIENRDHVRWAEIMRVDAPDDDAPAARAVHVPRPGHADRVGGIKYDRNDLRDILERASARETAMRVALGTIARAFLAEVGVMLTSRVVRIGRAVDESPWHDVPVAEIDASPVRALDPVAAAAMVQEIELARAAGDALGGVFEVVAFGAPVGLGSYAQWDRRLEAEVGRAFLSLNAIKGVEIGLGFGAAARPGSEAHDAYEPDPQTRTRYRTNRAGGIEGGMTTGQPIVVRVGMKPIATLMKPLDSVDLRTGEAVKAHIERADTCAVPAAAVIGESLLALVLADAVLAKFGGDSLGEVQQRVRAWEATARAR